MKLIFALFVLISPFVAHAACGTFEVSKGDVTVRAASGGAVTKASAGSRVCAGDTVIAAADSRAKIKMEDGNELNISPSSEIVFEQYAYDAAQNKKKVLLNILKGKVRATTREEHMYNDKAKDGQANSFQVKTKSAVAGVRGTDFLTSFDPSSMKTEVVTFRGEVSLGLASVGANGAVIVQNAVSVGVGQTSSMSLDVKIATPPVAVPPADLMKINLDTKLEGGVTAPPAPSAAQPVKSREKESGSGAASETRAPASVSPGSLLTRDDLGTGTKAPAVMPTTISVPNVPVVNVPQLPQSVKDKLESKTSNVTITIRCPGCN